MVEQEVNASLGTLFACVCARMCVRHAHVLACMHACMVVPVEAKGIFCYHFPPCLLRQDFLLNPELID